MTRGRSSAAAARAVRCAIYTRKSSEEGLEQAFNSLDAQREACAAYIQSQRHEGWTELPALYDDGGLSGGTLQRPALQRLLVEAAEGRIDVVVVYKVDRLTRSLADFAKIVEVFDAHGVSFVSVTQQFNTTSSMGRLTLNMLLSFAQFEREVTGERIRDKIAASKPKGMWMGGQPPLGYDAVDRELVVNPAEAETVRLIFRRYTEIGAVDALRRDLAGRGIVNKRHRRRDGSETGGRPLQRGALYRLLQNPIYRGRIRHRERVHDGRHLAIIDEELWQQVQARLQANRIADAHKTNARAPSLLAGLLVSDGGEPFTPSHANKAGRRYRYYVSRPAGQGETPAARRWRIPAGDLERLVMRQVRELLCDGRQLRSIMQRAGVPELDQLDALDRGALLAKELDPEAAGDALAEAAGETRTWLRTLLERVTAADAEIILTIRESALLQLLLLPERAAARPIGLEGSLELRIPARLQRAGMEMRLVDERAAAPAPDPTLIRLLAKAWAIRRDVLKAHGRPLAEIAAAHGVGDSYGGRLLRLGFLAPDIVEAIVTGTQPPALTANRLATLPEIPVDWPAQRALIPGR